MRQIETALAALLLVGGAACTDEVDPFACEVDADCRLPGTRCDTDTKQCVCVTDEACEEGFFCNNAGVCQEKSGCTTNDDCEDGTFCDQASGLCLNGPALGVGAACGLASHCPYGSICEGGSCVVGCFEDGDCPLGQICFEGMCASGDGVCSSNDFCEYGELCTANLRCEEDRRGPYCRGCTFRTAQNPVPCDHPRNFCLINSQEQGGHAQICGVDCSLEQPCPSGFNCVGVVILTQDICFNSAECQCSADPTFAGVCTIQQPCEPGAGEDGCRFDSHPDCGAGACLVATGTTTGSCTCGTDDDCEGDATCVSELCCPAGANVREDRECAGGEGRVSGFCTCATDDDCPQDSCDGTRGTCAITGLPCTPGANDCGPIPCVDGGCLIGRNCAPEQGLSCSVVGGQ